ncbi:tumor necrosis factor receptor type 1-associated DEATH domain protein [Platysternon megacephalum]|uniref:Tumor necrosis factor receptor type 1-associated DEATH domain protein n=1 Tax=Platysternon megacephalum TaxID=55544 RepID=A0A4D9DT62_9SAUR|nr:tumor necrosis factor receptor type 1-associated DEATH domain protein [Platysternon megacephalum]
MPLVCTGQGVVANVAQISAVYFPDPAASSDLGWSSLKATQTSPVCKPPQGADNPAGAQNGLGCLWPHAFSLLHSQKSPMVSVPWPETHRDAGAAHPRPCSNGGTYSDCTSPGMLLCLR